MDEFSFIEKYLSPLTFGKSEALSLKDDAAIIRQKTGYDLIITKDAIAEGTHFFAKDAPYDIAKKLLRVNISDLASKGAQPYCCFLGLILPKNITEKWLKDFTSGLRDDLQEFGCFLAGGDTSVHDGGLVLTLTALGYVPTGKAILRSDAKAGDLVFVTGTIGDSYLGLQLLQAKYSALSGPSKEFAINRYYIPQPRLSVGKLLGEVATSCADVSDGLLADLGNICKASKVGAEILLENVPLSAAAQETANLDSNFKINAITGGDDYELIFTVSAAMQNEIEAIAEKTGIRITKIGKILEGTGVKLLGINGEEIVTKMDGYKHNL